MNSMVSNYAREVILGDNATGHLFLNHDDARAAANEVLKDHVKQDRRAEEDNSLDDPNAPTGDRFEEVWNHFDVNKDGLVEVERMPQFFRMLLGNALDITLQ